MFFPYKVDVPMARWPIANWILIAATCIISIAMFGPLDQWGESHDSKVPPEMIEAFRKAGITLDGSPSNYPPVVDSFLLQPAHFRVQQLVGNLFVHAGWIHLLGNMWFLFVFGNAINAKLGHLKFVSLYLAIGLLESLCWLVFGPNTPCLGASGAIMGLIGAFLILYPQNDVSVGYWIGIIASGTLQLSAMFVIGAYIAFDIWGLARGRSSGVAYLAHVVGFILGAVATAVLLKTNLVEMDRGERSLLQVFKIMPDDGSYDPFARRPIPTRPGATSITVQARPRPAPPKPRDTGPISMD